MRIRILLSKEEDLKTKQKLKIVKRELMRLSMR